MYVYSTCTCVHVHDHEGISCVKLKSFMPSKTLGTALTLHVHVHVRVCIFLCIEQFHEFNDPNGLICDSYMDDLATCTRVN